MTRARGLRASLPASFMAVALGLGAGRASADPTPEGEALATALFQEGKTLLDAGRVPEACRKLEESHRLHPAGGTLLNVAVCHEKEGKTATAWAEFREARLIAERSQRDDRAALASEHIGALEPKLSKLVVRVSAAAELAGMTVTTDDRALNRPSWGTAMPVDPGDHVVAATAPGKAPWRTNVTILPDGDVKTVDLPAWEVASETPTGGNDIPASAVAASPAQVRPPPPARRNRTAAILAGSIGLGGVAMGSYFGLRSISKHSESNDACTTNPCSFTSNSLNDSAKTAADISTGAFAIGLVGLGLGAFLWFSASDASTGARAVRVVPALGPGRGALDVTGSF